MKHMIALGTTILAVAAPAFAGFTTVSPSPGGEFNHEQILEGYYGGDFSASGVDFTGGGAGGTISAIRWDDSLPPNNTLAIFGPTAGSAADQFWTDGKINVTAVARFAGNSQELGIDKGSGFESLFAIGGSSLAVSGNATQDLTGKSWNWIRRDEGGGTSFNSDETKNADGLDHMVTYQITGLPTNETVWLLCFEDLSGPLDGGSDRDFNDLVVEVRAIPEPATLGLLAVGGLQLLRRRRR